MPDTFDIILGILGERKIAMIYITGATGHIGNNLARLLVKENLDFRLLLRRSGPALEGLESKMILGDIFDPGFLQKHLASEDMMVHIAGLIDLKNNQPEASEMINNVGTRRIIDFCNKHGIRLIYTSSVDVLTRERSAALIREPENLYPEQLCSNYAVSKAKATSYLLEKIRNEGMDAVILYPSSVIGINDFKPSAAGNEIRLALKRRIFFYIRGGYNFIDVRDVAKAILSCIKKPIIGQYILSGYDRTLYEFYQEIVKNTKKKALMIPIPPAIAKAFTIFIPRFSKMMVDALLDNYHYDNSRMIDDLVPELLPFETTVKDTIEWFSRQDKQ